MVLAQFKFVRDNSKFIIIGAFIIGSLYPFFTDIEVPLIKDPKYLSIVALIVAAIVFWELYGQKQKTSYKSFPMGFQSEFRQPQQTPLHRSPTQHQTPPTSQYSPQSNPPRYPSPPKQPLYSPQTQIDPNLPTEVDISSVEKDIMELHNQYALGSIPEKDVTLQTQESLRPNLLDVVNRKQKLPDIILPPKDIPIKKSKSDSNSFEKFGIN